MRSYFIGRFRLPPGLEKHLMKLNIYKKSHNITCIDFKYFSRIKEKSFKSKSNKKKNGKNMQYQSTVILSVTKHY